MGSNFPDLPLALKTIFAGTRKRIPEADSFYDSQPLIAVRTEFP
jgi:hypothetical protein